MDGGPASEASSPLVPDMVAALEAFAATPLLLRALHLRGWAGPRRSQLLEWLRRRLVDAAREPSRGTLLGSNPPFTPRDRWLVLPHHTQVEQLESGVEITLGAGGSGLARRVGLLDRPEPPVVVVPMAERLAAPLACALASALDEGRLALILLDEALDDETGLWSGLADRVGLGLDLRDEGLLIEVLAELTDRSRVPSATVTDPVGSRASRTARPVVLEEAQAIDLASAALGFDIPSARPLLAAGRLACALAHQRGRVSVGEAELMTAVRLALLPHARRMPATDSAAPEAAESSESSAAPPPEPANPPERPTDQPPPGEPPPSDEHDDGANEHSPPLPDGSGERLVDAALASLPPGLLAELAGRAARQRSRARSSGAGMLTPRGRGRGRSVGARRGLPQAGQRLHLFATLRAAIPWQRWRDWAGGDGGAKESYRQAPSSSALEASSGRRVRLRKDDLHVHRELHRRGTTTVFVVDASGSTALQRLNEAKGAIELLLADCYVRRDRVALVSFRGKGADLLLAPTRSLVAARRALVALPGGGGSPVAAGLALAARLVSALVRSGDEVQVVVLTDGRANLTRDGRPGRAEAAEEALQMARSLGELASRCTLIDTSVRPEPAARALAQALQGRYCPMPFAQAQSIRAAIG